MNRKKLISSMLDLGEALLSAGGEINRVESSLLHVGNAFNIRETNVFALTTYITLTLEFDDGQRQTETRRITAPSQTDFIKLEALNNICRHADTMDIDEFSKSIADINKKRISPLKQYAGSFLTAFAFALFFGGNIYDSIVAGVFALLICFLQLHFAQKCPNKVFFYLVSAIVIGSGIFICRLFLPFINTDKIIIGDIMLLIPGIAITNAVRDIIIGDTVSGIIKFAESLIFAISLAGGFMLVMSIFGGIFG